MAYTAGVITTKCPAYISTTPPTVNVTSIPSLFGSVKVSPAFTFKSLANFSEINTPSAGSVTAFFDFASFK